MLKNKLAIAAVAVTAAAAALSAHAGPRMEADIGPFTYEAVGATPSLTFGRKAAPQAADARKPAAGATAAGHAAAPRAGTGGAFTYDALGATPRVEVKRQPPAEPVTRQPSR